MSARFAEMIEKREHWHPEVCLQMFRAIHAAHVEDAVIYVREVAELVANELTAINTPTTTTTIATAMNAIAS